ncbi:MAG: flagellar export chaperone FliS, partial [Planctomycetota bacterium]
MSPSARAYQAYRTAEVQTISQRDLLIKLFEGIQRFLLQAQRAMQDRRIEEAHTGCTKAKRIFVELLSTLNFEQGGEIAGQLRDLYLFAISEISVANLYKDPEKLAGILQVVEPLLQAWRPIPE